MRQDNLELTPNPFIIFFKPVLLGMGWLRSWEPSTKKKSTRT